MGEILNQTDWLDFSKSEIRILMVGLLGLEPRTKGL